MRCADFIYAVILFLEWLSPAVQKEIKIINKGICAQEDTEALDKAKSNNKGQI